MSVLTEFLAYARSRDPSEAYEPSDGSICALTQFEQSRDPTIKRTYSHFYDNDLFTAAMLPDNAPGHTFVYTWGGLVKRLEVLAL